MKFKKEEVVAIKTNPKFGLIAIKCIDYTLSGVLVYQLYNGNWYPEDLLLSRKEWEYNKDFEELIKS